MTLNEPNCRRCFGFLLLARAQLFKKKYEINLRKIFRTGSPTGIDDRCGIGLDFLFNPHIFRHSYQYVTNFVQSAVGVVGVDEVDCRRVLLTTSTHLGTDFSP